MKILTEKLVSCGLVVDKTDTETVDFKEALVFAYLGLRCLLGKENVFANTTGARYVIYNSNNSDLLFFS